MLKAANVRVDDAIAIFNAAGATFGLLVPTETGYEKSIMDATIGFRDFLMEANVHNYMTQKQGPEHKVKIPAQFVYPDKCVSTSASLYRPQTKKGDPRIWFARLGNYCKPTDLLVVLADQSGVLSVFNMSNMDIVKSFGIPGSYPYEILSACASYISPVASELLTRLKEIRARGFIEGVSHGDTNVGMTLENLLGISPNSSKEPDYKGIELKSRRGKPRGGRGGSDKITLFANVPDWKRGAMSAKEIIETFGYIGEHGPQLYCTVSNVANSQGLYLDASDEIDLINKANTPNYVGDVAVWALSTLKDRLNEKHRETFWVYAKSDIIDGKEHFQYDYVRHTRKPNSTNLGSFFDAGIVTLDYTMHLKASGGVRDHGYLFRTTREHFNQIFPLEKIYDLSKV